MSTGGVAPVMDRAKLGMIMKDGKMHKGPSTTR